jgi:hypothetical protein
MCSLWGSNSASAVKSWRLTTKFYSSYQRVLDMYAGGMTVRDIGSHLERPYGVQIGRDTISRVTDAVLEDIAAWRSRPLEAVYPIVYFDALQVKVTEDRSVSSRACYLAVGVTVDGDREALGIWWQDTEGSKFWLAVLNDLHQRGVSDVLIACVDGLTGFPDAIEAVFPEAWVQTCIVHQIRASMRYVSYQDRRKVAAALKPVYNAANADQALVELDAFDEVWGERYPMIAEAWRQRWEHITPFLALPPSSGGSSTRPTRSRRCTATSAKRSRRAGTSPTSRPPPSSSTSQSNEPRPNGAPLATGPQPDEPSKSTSETDCPTDMTTVASASHTEGRTPSKARPTAPFGLASSVSSKPAGTVARASEALRHDCTTTARSDAASPVAISRVTRRSRHAKA